MDINFFCAFVRKSSNFHTSKSLTIKYTGHAPKILSSRHFTFSVKEDNFLLSNSQINWSAWKRLATGIIIRNCYTYTMQWKAEESSLTLRERGVVGWYKWGWRWPFWAEKWGDRGPRGEEWWMGRPVGGDVRGWPIPTSLEEERKRNDSND